MGYLKCKMTLKLCNSLYLTPLQTRSTCNSASKNVSTNYIVDSSEEKYIHVS